MDLCPPHGPLLEPGNCWYQWYLDLDLDLKVTNFGHLVYKFDLVG
jgi:hypothetical protein